MKTVFRWVSWLLIAMVLIAGIGFIALYLYSAAPANPNEKLFFGGTVITMSKEQGDAVLVRNGRIVAIGEKAELMKQSSVETQLIDLTGGTLMPGLIEPHSHPIATAMLGAAIDVSGFTHNNRADVMKTLKEASGGIQLGAWIVAFGWDPVLITDLEPPTLAELDALSPERPLLILTQMMHDAYINSAAIKAAGIGPNTPDPQGGHFLRDANGELTGTIREVSAINHVLAAMPKPPAGITPLLVNMKLQDYAEAGYTSLGVLGPVGRAADPLSLLAALSNQPTAALRTAVWALPKQLDPASKPIKGDRFSVRGVKFWMDGSPFAGGAAWAEPYENSDLIRKRLELPENHSPELNFAAEEFEKQFRDYHQRGFSIAVHVQGERAIDRVLDIASRVIGQYPRPDHRHRLEHNALITKAQIQRAKSLGFTLSFFVDHIWFYGHRLPEIVGEQRTARYMPLANASTAGHRVTFHGDHPATPIQPFRTLKTAVTRSSRSGGEVAKDQALTVMQGLQAMTTNAAWQLGLEDQVGSIEVGKIADLVWLDKNPLTTPANQLDTIEAKATWLAGQRVDTRRISRGNLALVKKALSQ